MKKNIQFFLIAIWGFLATPSFATLSHPNSTNFGIETTQSAQNLSQKTSKNLQRSEKSARLWKRVFGLGGLAFMLGAVIAPAGSVLATALFGGAALCLVLFFVAYRFF